jgi:hypothetical protein
VTARLIGSAGGYRVLIDDDGPAGPFVFLEPLSNRLREGADHYQVRALAELLKVAADAIASPR